VRREPVELLPDVELVRQEDHLVGEPLGIDPDPAGELRDALLEPLPLGREALGRPGGDPRHGPLDQRESVAHDGGEACPLGRAHRLQGRRSRLHHREELGRGRLADDLLLPCHTHHVGEAEDRPDLDPG